MAKYISGKMESKGQSILFEMEEVRLHTSQDWLSSNLFHELLDPLVHFQNLAAIAQPVSRAVASASDVTSINI
jgi:hypothetical protein